MPMTPAALEARLAASLRSEDARGLAGVIDEAAPYDVFEALREWPSASVGDLLLLLPPPKRPLLFAYLQEDMQDAVLLTLPRDAVVDLFERLPSDDRADVFKRLDEPSRAKLLPALAQVEREDILRLAAYPEESVGSITTSDYATVSVAMLAGEALDAVRVSAPDKETIYVLYVLDEGRRLLGTVSLRDLVLAPPHTRVEDLMHREPVFAQADWPRARAAGLIRHYDLLALPVLGADNQVVGIVTVDDAMRVEQDEATDDILRVGAVQPGGRGRLDPARLSLRHASVFQLFRMRVFWLVLLVFGNLLSGAGIAYYEDTVAAYIALVFFLPLLIGSGGNAGSQAATLMVRALATGDVVARDWVRMLGREFLVASLLGVAMAVAVSGIGFVRGGPEIAGVVSISMVLIVVVGSLIGMCLPFLLSKLRFDPATASAPLVTSIADAVGVILYLSIAVLVLGEPQPA
jgi:magnesium transporter